MNFIYYIPENIFNEIFYYMDWYYLYHYHQIHNDNLTLSDKFWTPLFYHYLSEYYYLTDAYFSRFIEAIKVELLILYVKLSYKIHLNITL